MREFDLLRQSLAGPAATALFDVPWTPLYLLVAFLIHPLLGLLVLGAGSVLVTLAIVNERRSKTKAEEAHHASAAAYESHEAMLRRAEIVRAQTGRASGRARVCQYVSIAVVAG